MKAIVCSRYGPPEVLQLTEVPKPVPKHNEVLVKIVATAVNSGDVRVRGLAVKGIKRVIMRLALGFFKPRKSILGTVYSGIIEHTGESVSKFKTGDNVFGMTGFNFGTYAEYMVIKETSNVTLMPQHASFEEAVSLVFGGQTALYFLEKIKAIKKDRPKVLIVGATGSVGSAALQIAQHYGAEVTAVCSTQGKPLATQLGVNHIVLYDKEDFTQTTSKFDFVFDAVGKTSKKKCKMILAPGGVFKSVEGFEYASESVEQLTLIKQLYETGKYKAVIDKTFTLNQVVEAHAYVDTGRKKGNVILQVCNNE